MASCTITAGACTSPRAASDAADARAVARGANSSVLSERQPLMCPPVNLMPRRVSDLSRCRLEHRPERHRLHVVVRREKQRVAVVRIPCRSSSTGASADR